MVASVVILILLALLGLIVRQIQGGRLRLRGQVAGRQRQPRLGVVDTYDLDRQRQLVLIRRDNIEHLVMIGGSSDVVVETNIMRSGSRAVVPSYAETAIPDRPLPPFETLVPPSEPAIRAGEEARRNAATPDVLPALPTRPASSSEFSATAGVAASLGISQAGFAPTKPAASPGPLPSVATGPAPSFAREHAPQPPVSPGELDDMTRQLEEALKRPFSAVRPAHLPDESPAEIVAPPVKPPAPAPVVQPAVAAPKPEPKPAPKVVPAASHIPVMPASPQHGPLPGSVEAELAAALGLSPDHAVSRPVEINAPEVRVPEPRAPEPKFVQTRPSEPRVVEPKPAEPKPAEPKPAESKPVPAAVKPEPQPAPPPEPEPEPELEPEPMSAVAEVEPVVVEAKPEPKPEPAPEPPAAPDPKEIDPFSVDAIEAEFARLLGRDPKAKS
ncbi:hypothetical protein BoBH3_13615 [Bosea sp. BH3]|nr:hypothetical protein [Bosea sp. BH3]